MYQLVYQDPTDCRLVPVDSRVEVDGRRVAAGPLLMVYYGGRRRWVVPRVEDDLEFAVAEEVIVILPVQLAVELGKLEGLLQCCRVPHVLLCLLPL